MSLDEETDWDPALYHRFRGLRLRPALDLLRSVGPLPEGPVVDLGCGSGAVGPALGQLRRPLVGVDSSATMLAYAKRTGVYADLHECAIEAFEPEAPVAMVFSNAVLHWVDDHETLLPRLLGMLTKGGVLAVQIPAQNNAPSHRLWYQIADEMFPRRAADARPPKILLPAEYHRLLEPAGRVTLWETEYYQDLAPDGEGNPVRRFTEGTYARPLLALLEEDEKARLIAAYEAAITKAYPMGPRGNVLFPFRRLFFTVHT